MASGKEAARRKKKEQVKRAKAKVHHHRVKRDIITAETVIPDTAVPLELLADIQAKRDLLVGDDLTTQIVRRYLRKNESLIPRLTEPQFIRSAEYEKMKKWVRQELRVLVGMFVLDGNMEKLLDSRTPTILNSHRSTLERMNAYPTLYAELFAGKMPKHILDLCAGLNGCAYEYLGCAPRYTAVDVSPQLMDFTAAWFVKNHIDGTAYAADVTQLPDEALVNGDTVLIFKGTDVLERVRYGYGDVLLDKLFRTPGRRVIVSFATATMSGTREIAVKKRSWVERWAERHHRTVRIVDTENERYYVLE